MIKKFDFHKSFEEKNEARKKAQDSHWDELQELELEDDDTEVVTAHDDEMQKLLDKLEMTQEEFTEQFPALSKCLIGEVEEAEEDEEDEEVKAEDSDDLIADYERRIAEAKRTGDTETEYYYQDLLDEILRDRDRGGFEDFDDTKSKLKNGYVIFINNNDGYAALVPRDKMDDETEYLELELEEAEELIEKYELALLEQSDQSQNTEVYGFENKAEDSEDKVVLSPGDIVEIRQYGVTLEGEIVRPVKKEEVNPGLNNPDAGQYYLVKTCSEKLGCSESIIWEGNLTLITKADIDDNESLNDLESPVQAALEELGYELVESEDGVEVYHSAEAGIRIDFINEEIYKYTLADSEETSFTDEEIEALDVMGFVLVDEELE